MNRVPSHGGNRNMQRLCGWRSRNCV
jgi:hypothetical protein